MKLSLERQIPLAFLAALILLVTISFFAYRQITALNEAVKWEKHTQEVLQQLDGTLALVVDAETSGRGFIISGNEDFLEPYNHTNQVIGENLQRLKNSIADNKEQTQKVSQLETLIYQRLGLIKQFIAIRRTEGLTNTLSQSTGRGKSLMDEIRALIGQMKDVERNILIEREAELDSTISGTYRILILGSIAGIFSLGLANLAIFRETGKRSRAEEKIKIANRDLEKRVGERTVELSESNEQLKENELALRRSESFVRTVLDSLPAHIAVLDEEGNIVEVNRAWNNFASANCVEEKINSTGTGQNYLRVCENSEAFEEETQQVLKNLRAILKGGQKEFSFEYPCHSPTEERWFLMQVSRMENGAVVSHIDISERKKSEIKLKNSEEFNRSIFENSPDCVKVLNLDGTLNRMNKNGMCIMEIDDFAHFKGKIWTDFWTGEENGKAIEAVENARHGKTGRFEGYTETAKGNLKYWDVTVAPIFDNEGNPRRIISTSRDITERKINEAEREKLLEREQAARREAEIATRLRDEFLATVSHELRAPLNAILGWARLLQQGRLDEKSSPKALQTIVRNAEAQSRLIEDLLDVSRIISGKLRLEVMPVKPIIFVESALETVRPAAEAKNITFEIQEDAEVSHISGDPNRLQQVIWNLLSNAIKFTPNGGKVSVEIKRQNTHVAIKVRDTGVGIKPEFLPHVFDRFSQADASSIRKFGGLGLGLAIVRHLTEMHGGTVRVESEGENQGSVFIVELPLTVSPLQEENEPAVNHSQEEKISGLSLDGLLILVVDDEEDTRQLMVQTLTHYGATIVTANSAANALRAVENQKPDVLVSDIGMPDEDGYSLIRKVRALNIEIPAVALTAFTRAQDRMRALSAGFQNHVGKPVEPEELVTVIASLTGRLQMNEE